MNIKTEFTEPECEFFRKVCNFADDELVVFNLLVKNKTVTQIEMILKTTQYAMSEATIKRRKSNIKQKILKVL